VGSSQVGKVYDWILVLARAKQYVFWCFLNLGQIRCLPSRAPTFILLLPPFTCRIIGWSGLYIAAALLKDGAIMKLPLLLICADHHRNVDSRCVQLNFILFARLHRTASPWLRGWTLYEHVEICKVPCQH